jgi:hypothetical protein
MRHVFACSLLLAVATACGGSSNTLECAVAADCNSHPFAQCAPAVSGKMYCQYGGEFAAGCASGLRWSSQAGDGLGDACVEAADGGIPDANTDAHPDGPDADMPDAQPDGATSPPIISGAQAELVLGQMTLSSSGPDVGGESARSMDTPVGVAVAGGKLWTCDVGNSRVLQWNALPLVNNAAANLVVGQASFTTHTDHTTPPTQSALYTTSGYACRVFSDGTRLYVVDSLASRVLIWNTIPATNGAPADVVLGQLSFTTFAQGSGATGLNLPHGLWTDGTKLVVADTVNRRVLIWNAVPTSNGKPADVVLGQSDFGMTTVPHPPTDASMFAPTDVFFDGTRLFVTDEGYHRVMVWNSMPTANGAPADFFLGQPSGLVEGKNAGGVGPNAVGLDHPTAVYVAAGSLFIVDGGNRRIVVHTPVPTGSGEAADAVLGQDNLTSIAATTDGAAPNRIGNPTSIAIEGTSLFATDASWNRVLRFTLSHP